jgi:hypothetical protein
MRHAMQRTLAFGLLCGLVSCMPDRGPRVDVTPPSDTPDSVGPYRVTAVIRSDAPVVRAEVRWSVEAGTPVPLTLRRQADSDVWQADIPGQPVGAVVRLLVEVEDDEGHLVVKPDPIPGETATYAFRVYAPLPESTDAGSEVDAGSEADAGADDLDGGSDAGSAESDAGLELDGGTPVDAGEADAG